MESTAYKEGLEVGIENYIEERNTVLCVYPFGTKKAKEWWKGYHTGKQGK